MFPHPRERGLKALVEGETPSFPGGAGAKINKPLSATDLKPVIVAGAGPAGLIAAAALIQEGIPVVLCEKHAELNRASKASTFHPASLEVLNHLGLVDILLARGVRVEQVQYRTVTAGLVAEFSMQVLSRLTQFPYRIHLEQSELTEVILAWLEESSLFQVRFKCEVRDVENRGQSVSALVRTRDGQTRIQGRYLIAADGAHSRIRNALNIAFPGGAYDTRVLRIFTAADLEELIPGLAPLSYLFGDADSCSLLKMPDCWRIILRIPVQVPDQTALSPDWYGKVIKRFLPLDDDTIARSSADIFPVSRRVAETNRVGRTFLIGDAAHLTNTRGGMNMNCGIHDAYAIGRAIAHACKEDNADQALAACAQERLRIAQEELVSRTESRLSSIGQWPQKAKSMAADPAQAREFLCQSSMLDIASIEKKSSHRVN